MRVSNFKFDHGTKHGSVMIRISSEDLITLLDRDGEFSRVIKSVLRGEYHYSFGIHRTSIEWIEFNADDLIQPFRDKLPNRFYKKNAASTAIASSMLGKYCRSRSYRQNLVRAMDQDVIEWKLKFIVTG